MATHQVQGCANPQMGVEEKVKMERFIPVVVKGGRKFRGEAYDICSEVRTSHFNVYGMHGGVNGWRTTETVKLWSPVDGFVYCNPNYIEDRVADDEVVRADFDKYADGVVKSTIDWCSKNSKVGQNPFIFALNVLRKHHPETIEVFHKITNNEYRENLTDTILSTVVWAMGLGYRSDKVVRIAYRALVKKGIVNNPQFNNAWVDVLNSRCLGKYAERYAA